MDEIKDLIDKFWAGTATAAEKERLHSFLKEYDPEWKLMLESDYGQADMPQLRLGNDRMQHILGQLHEQMGEPEIPAQPEKKVFRIGHVYKWVAAAMLLLIAGAGFMQWRHMQNPATLAIQQPQTILPAVIMQANNDKTIKKVLLADGSTVLLHPGSSIVYHKTFGTQNRDITLDGAAQFNVAQHVNAPFKVYTDGLVTTALGTEFLIRKGAQGQITIRLITGKVVVQEKQHRFLKDTYLAIGQELTVNAQTRQFALTMPRSGLKPPVMKAPELAADNTVMEFDKTPLTRVFDRLGSFYGKQIRYHKNGLHHLSFTGTFGQNDSLQTALTVICNMNNLVFTVEQDTIYINR